MTIKQDLEIIRTALFSGQISSAKVDAQRAWERLTRELHGAPDGTEQLPDRIEYGEWAAVPGRYTEGDGLYWDLVQLPDQRLGTLVGAVGRADLREVLYALAHAYQRGSSKVRADISKILGG